MEHDTKDFKLRRHMHFTKMSHNEKDETRFFIRRYDESKPLIAYHTHEYMQINYVCQGKAKHYVKNNEFDIIKGDIFVIPPKITHYIDVNCYGHVEIIEFEFYPEFINQNFNIIENAEAFLDFAYIEPFLLSETQIKPRLNLIGKVQIEVENLLTEALQEYTEKTTGYEFVIKALLLKLLVTVGREYKKDTANSDDATVFIKHKDAIYGAVKYLNEHYNEDLNSEDVARRFALSSSYFRYLFKSITSKTFSEYMNSIRISNAMQLLKNSDLRVIDICYEVGFNNIHYFNRVFKQHTGLNPREFKKNKTE